MSEVFLHWRSAAGYGRTESSAPYEWQRFALRDVGDAVPYEQAVVIPAAP